MRDRLIIALDVPNLRDAELLVKELGDKGRFYKIGHQLAFGGGLSFAKELIDEGKHVFLDMKLLDIDNTVAKGVENIAKMGVDMLTIHAYPKAMRAAVEAAKGTSLCLLGVTVLTSMDGDDLKEAGYQDDPQTLVQKRVDQAKAAGMGGVVCAPTEAQMVRQRLGPQMAIVTPGIRPVGAEKGDQKRVMTPKQAIEAGASHLVVGRPITQAQNRCAVVDTILAQMQE